MKPPYDGVAHSDNMYARSMAAASLTFLRVLNGKREAPAELVWRDKHLPANWVKGENSLTSAMQVRYGEVARAKIELAESLRIDSREGCPKCGVRGDIGCKHTARGW